MWPGGLINKYKVPACFLKTLKNYKKVSPKAASNLRSSVLSLSLVLQCTVHSWRLSKNHKSLQAAFETAFRVTGGYLKARTRSLKRVTGKFFTMSK